MSITNVFPCILINLVRSETGSGLWNVCPPEFVDDFLRHNDPGRCKDHYADKLPGWRLYRWIAVDSPQEAHAVVEEGYWPE